MKHLTRQKLIILRGPMGVGKSTLGEALLLHLPAAAYLDGDWCWKTHPFFVDDASRELVVDNIIYLLRGYLGHPDIRHVILGWVLQQDSTLRQILQGLADIPFELRCYKLICSPDALRTRLLKDVRAGRRMPDVIERSLAYLPLYESLQGTPVDVGAMSPEEALKFILWDLL